jgi:hypothetical protein
MVSGVVALLSLALIVGSLIVLGGALFAPFLLGLFLLALVGVIGGLEDRTVRQRDPSMDPRRWRDGP